MRRQTRPPQPKTVARRAWEVVHKASGYGAVVASVAACITGVLLLFVGADATTYTACVAVLYVVVFATFGVMQGAAVIRSRIAAQRAKDDAAIELRRATRRAAAATAPAATHVVASRDSDLEAHVNPLRR